MSKQNEFSNKALNGLRIVTIFVLDCSIWSHHVRAGPIHAMVATVITVQQIYIFIHQNGSQTKKKKKKYIHTKNTTNKNGSKNKE